MALRIRKDDKRDWGQVSMLIAVMFFIGFVLGGIALDIPKDNRILLFFVAAGITDFTAVAYAVFQVKNMVLKIIFTPIACLLFYAMGFAIFTNPF